MLKAGVTQPHNSKKMPEELLADIPKEGEEQNPFKTDEKEKETPSESPTKEKTEQEKSPPQEGEEGKEEKPDNTPDEDKVPFHKHPRWKEVQEDRRQLKEQVDELTRFKEEVAPKLSRLEEQRQPIPKWFADTFGENETAWQEFQNYDKKRRDEVKQEIYQEQQKAFQDQEKQSLICLDSDGLNRAPVYNVASIINKMAGDVYDEDGKSKENFETMYKKLERKKGG